MSKDFFPKELRAMILAIIALTAALALILALLGRQMVKTDVVGARERLSETFTYGKYGALYRFDGRQSKKLVTLPYADTDESVVPNLVDWANLTSDEKTVYFVDTDENYDSKLYRKRVGSKAAPEKVSSHLVQYAVCGDDVFYLRSSGGLYKNEDRLAGDIAEMKAISFDSKRVLALDDESRLFMISAGKENQKKRIDRDVSGAGAIDDNLDMIWYITEDDSLYIYDFPREHRTYLGEYAWDEAADEPDCDNLFYHVYDRDGDDLGLFYYDAEAGTGRNAGFSDSDTVLSVGCEPLDENIVLYAVVADKDGEIDLRRCFMGEDNYFAAWETAAKDLDDEPASIVAGDDGTLYYLRGAALFADSSDLKISASGIFYGDGALYIVSDIDDDAMTFTLSVLDGSKARRIADDVYIYRTLSDGTVVTLRDFSDRRGEGDLYLTAGGRDRLLDRDVMWFSDAQY